MDNKIIKSIKYRIFPTDEQKVILNNCFGARRWCWNYLCNLIFKTDYIRQVEKFSTTTISLRNYIRQNGPEWVASGSKTINETLVENVASDFSKAYSMYYKKAKLYLKEARIHEIDKFKPKNKTKKEMSFSFTLGKKSEGTFKIINGMLNTNITRHIGRQTFITKKKISINSKSIKQINFKYENGKYYMTLVYENQVKSKPYISGSKIGIDLGMKTSAVCYDGNKYFNYKLPDMVIKLRNKKDKINSKFSQAKNNSKNKLKLLKRLNKSYKRMINFRNNWQDHIVCDLCKKYETIIIDDMPKLSKGFNKHNNKKLSIAPGRFIYRLNNKSMELQNNIIIVKSGTPTTQTCSNCGNVKSKDEKLTLNDRTYECKCCGYIKDRDENSAKNIYNYN